MAQWCSFRARLRRTATLEVLHVQYRLHISSPPWTRPQKWWTHHERVWTRLPKISSASTAEAGRINIFDGRRRSSDWTRPQKTVDASSDFSGCVHEEKTDASMLKNKRVHRYLLAHPLNLLDASIGLKDTRVIKCGKNANHVLIPAFRKNSRTLPYYRLKYLRISKLTYLHIFNHAYICVSNWKPATKVAVDTKSFSARPPLLLPYPQPRPAVT